MSAHYDDCQTRTRYMDYSEALAVARARANATGLDCGIRKVNEYGKWGYNVSLLPQPEKSFGSDARAERVRPNINPAINPKTTGEKIHDHT